jgi:hypothetical protein
MHDDTPEGYLLAKAARVCEAGIRRRSLPTNRNQLRQHLAHIRAELRNRRDPLDGFGLSVAGLRSYFTNLGADYHQADLLAGAAAELIQFHNA